MLMRSLEKKVTQMQVVIEISERDKEYIDNGFRSSSDVYTMRNLIIAVQQGIVLPKCHSFEITKDGDIIAKD